MIKNVLTPTTDESLSNISISFIKKQILFYDGLSRFAQEVDVQASPLYRDLVKFAYYDANGRENKDRKRKSFRNNSD